MITINELIEAIKSSADSFLTEEGLEALLDALLAIQQGKEFKSFYRRNSDWAKAEASREEGRNFSLQLTGEDPVLVGRYSLWLEFNPDGELIDSEVDIVEPEKADGDFVETIAYFAKRWGLRLSSRLEEVYKENT